MKRRTERQSDVGIHGQPAVAHECELWSLTVGPYAELQGEVLDDIELAGDSKKTDRRSEPDVSTRSEQRIFPTLPRCSGRLLGLGCPCRSDQREDAERHDQPGTGHGANPFVILGSTYVA